MSIDRVKKVISLEVAASIIFPLFISITSFVVAQAKYNERIVGMEKRIEAVDTTGTTKLNQHLIDDTRSAEQLMAEIKVLQSKVDDLRTDIKEIKKK